MSKRYDEVMEKIEVTDAMRQRILINISRMDLNTASRFKGMKFTSAKRIMSLAACFILLLAGAFSTRYFVPGATVDPLPTEGIMVGNNIVEEADDAALSEAVGFPVKEVGSLPFRADEVTYTSFWNELAEVTYTGEGKSLTLRQSLGEGDNSGDYNVYDETVTEEIGGRNVTLKGDGQSYVLAAWSDGTYAYSIRMGSGLTLSEWETVIGNM